MRPGWTEPSGADGWRLRAELCAIALQACTSEAFLTRAVAFLRERLGAAQVAFWVVDGGGATMTPTHASPPGQVLPLAASLLRELGEGVVPQTVAVPGAGGGLRTCVVGPVRRGRTLVGLLQVVPTASGFEPDLLAVAGAALELFATGLQAAQRLERLRWEAGHDPLTALPNRRSWQAMLEREARLAERHGLPLSVLLVDVDHFKPFNDRHGHAAGDALLRAIARQLRRAGRKTDCVARYGGEEFVVLLPHTDRAGAARAANKLLEAVRRVAGWPVGRGEPTTASVGSATWPDDCRSPRDLVPDADRAMYQAKRQGRDRVVQAGAASRAEGP